MPHHPPSWLPPELLPGPLSYRTGDSDLPPTKTWLTAEDSRKTRQKGKSLPLAPVPPATIFAGFSVCLLVPLPHLQSWSWELQDGKKDEHCFYWLKKKTRRQPQTWETAINTFKMWVLIAPHFGNNSAWAAGGQRKPQGITAKLLECFSDLLPRSWSLGGHTTCTRLRVFPLHCV